MTHPAPNLPLPKVPDPKVLRHDLRTSVNHILGFGEMILESLAENFPTARAALEKIMGRASQSLELLDESAREKLRYTVADIQELATSADLEAPLRETGSEDDFNRLRHAAQRMQELLDGLEAPVVTAEPARNLTLLKAPPIPTDGGRILVVDDDPGNRDILSRLLKSRGYAVNLAADGRQALESLQHDPVDLIISDLAMPVLDGLQLLREVRGRPDLAEVPVVMTSGMDQVDLVVECLRAGAEDYVTKPFNQQILLTRVQVLMEHKRYRDLERKQRQELVQALENLDRQKKESDRLLLNILPETVASELVSEGSVEPMYFEDITVVTTDFVGFTSLTERQSADELVTSLHRYFTAFDLCVQRYRLEKLKTVGDAYLYMAGIPKRIPSHPVDAVLAAFEIVESLRHSQPTEPGLKWEIRVGVHTGPVIAGVVGIHKFAFDIWGDTINLCDRLQKTGAPGRINVSDRTYWRIKDFFECEPRGRVTLPDGRTMEMYFVNSVLPKLRATAGGKAAPPAFAKRYHTYFRSDVPAFPEFLSGGASALSVQEDLQCKE